MQLILHVGAPKTGTTSLQHVFSANRRVLRRQGLVYPEARPGTRHHHHFARDVAQAPARARDLLARMAAQAAPDETLLLSSEVLFLGARGYAGQGMPDPRSYERDRQAYLDDLAEMLGGFDCEVVLFLRRPDAFAEALYKTFIWGDRCRLGFGDFVAAAAPFFDYERIVADFRARFPTRLLSYERHRHDLSGAFFAGVAPPLPPPEEHNPSPDARLTCWMAETNRRRPAGRRTVKLRRAFCLSKQARRLFPDYGRTTLWQEDPHGFSTAAAGGLAADLAAEARAPRPAAVLSAADLQRIDAAFRLWRLRRPLARALWWRDAAGWKKRRG